MNRTAIVALTLMLVACAKGADPYWVSPTGTAPWSAARSASPLEGTNCASLSTANTSLVAGDVVFLRGGRYETHLLPSRSGESNNVIAYLAYTNETPVIANFAVTYATYVHGILLRGCSWIKIEGVTVDCPDEMQRPLMITHGASYNEIKNCIINGNGKQRVIQLWDGQALPAGGVPCVHNWIHGCTIHSTGQLEWNGSYVDDKGGMQIGVPSYDNHSGQNTIERCTFYGGGHHNLETFTTRNVLRANFLHFEGSMPNTTGRNPLNGPDENGLWGNRNLQVYDGYNSDGTFNLLEANRFGTSGPPPDDDGGDSLTITAPKNIIRYNYIYNSQNNGVLFKMGGGSYSHTNRFYNNTVFRSGRFRNTNALWQGALFRFYGSYTNFGTVLKNNLFSQHGGQHEIPGGPSNPSRFGTLITNNFHTTDGDPLFVSTNITDPTDISQPDLRLKPGSRAIDGGIPLTFAVGSGANSPVIVVDDPLYFQDGTWGSVLAGHRADQIAVGSKANVRQIARVDYESRTITLTSPVTWEDGAPIWLYSISDGSVVFNGAAPDLGAYETESGESVPTTVGGLRTLQ